MGSNAGDGNNGRRNPRGGCVASACASNLTAMRRGHAMLGHFLFNGGRQNWLTPLKFHRLTTNFLAT